MDQRQKRQKVTMTNHLFTSVRWLLFLYVVSHCNTYWNSTNSYLYNDQSPELKYTFIAECSLLGLGDMMILCHLGDRKCIISLSFRSPLYASILRHNLPWWACPGTILNQRWRKTVAAQTRGNSTNFQLKTRVLNKTNHQTVYPHCNSYINY